MDICKYICWCIQYRGYFSFPNGNYWSSVARTSDSNAWNMNSNGNGTANYNWNNKTNTNYVRCVQDFTTTHFFNYKMIWHY